MSDPCLTVDELGRESGAVVPAVSMPTHIGRYRIERVLGKGGFGLVYLAHDEQLQRLVAIKVPHSNLVSRPEDAEAYLTEARTVASLDHPHIVPVYDVGSTDGFPCYVVSKYIEGSTLAQRIKVSRPSVAEAAELVAIVAETLHYAHKQGIIHRDIKPGNILLDTGGKPYVADFGLALREQDVGKRPCYAGTPAYMSPEQARGEGHRVDGRSDMFSLGIVFYELLTGRRPFKADSRDELLDQIASMEPRPPRQVDDTIPKELERICLKALAKRASDRYTTAKDMADDLRHFLSAAPDEGKSTPTGRRTGEADATTPTPSPVPTPADQQVVKIVPKGLRSFDATDANFFLELLPGPRDRDGLPDSIRFWKTRIETNEADSTFSVGLIYGPSGCGKSSLVKAGLLPKLAKSALAVYVETTGEETEARLLKGLRRQLPDLPNNLGLIESLGAVRRGHYLEPGQKVLLALDQFEQWLHAKRNEENTELVQALRHCDGGRLQAIVMVRDDFWLAVSRFMQALEIRVLEGENSRLVDLFDPRHATKVLTAFGRSFGALPEKELGKEQAAFLDQAVSGLAQDGKVISVRLALFAEMVKGKQWTPATLKEVGGTEGVGVMFLEETFTASTAPPQHRLHQKAAQAVLKALLPAAGTDIKGHMRSQQDLLEASGYAKRPRDFDDLLRILDSEIRLITPTDPEGKEDAEPSTMQAGDKYYQLTHDYLVPSLRDWLTRKQKETRRGRAELLLADRAAVWTARPENRQLPSLLQWFNIRWWTQKKNWTPPQKKMMAKAGRYHGVRGVVLALLVAAVTIASWVIRDQVEQKQNETHAAGLVQAVIGAEVAQVPDIIRKMADYRQWTDRLLRKEYDKAGDKSQPRLHASLALLPVDRTQVAYLYERLLDAEPHEVPVIRDALASHKDELLEKLWAVVEKPEKGKESQRLRATAALAKYDSENEKWGQIQEAVGNDLVAVPAVYLSLWKDSLRPVRTSLVPQLAKVYRDTSRREIERSLATEILADYAGDDAGRLADLLMDADEKQFAVIYPKFKEHGDRSVAEVLAELDKRVVVAMLKDKVIFETKGMIAEEDATVKTQNGPLLAKRFEVRLQAGKTYRLTMDSNDIDSFLVLQDKTGKEPAFDDDSGGGVNSLLLYKPSSDDTYTVFAASLPNPMVKSTGSFVLKVVETVGATVSEDDARENLAKRQANGAVALLKMNQAEKVWPLLKHSPDPRLRSYLIHKFAPLGADAGLLIARFQQEKDVSIRRALLLSLGDVAAKDAERQSWIAEIVEIYRKHPDPGLHGASEWLLRQWRQDGRLKEIDAELATGKLEGGRRWYVNKEKQTFAVVIPNPKGFWMGSPGEEVGRAGGPKNKTEMRHWRKIERTYAIASKEVTVAQFFRCPTFDKDKFGYNKVYSKSPDHPMNTVTWYAAAEYCNWLSREEGLEECYVPNARGEYADGMKMKPGYLKLTGYRLPTEAEWEYACRAETTTARYYGETDELLGKYAWYIKNSLDRWMLPEAHLQVGEPNLKPNDFGLFHMLGNASEWCQDDARLFSAGTAESPTLDNEYNNDINSGIFDKRSRVLRGGSFINLASYLRSALRINYVPATRNTLIGFRPARTLPLGSFTTLPLPPQGVEK
jgi:serine/threonine protein kinase/formylglycine-generating enzyme required for sulfatase activity